MSISYALEEGFISLFLFDDRITLVNFRLLPFRLVRLNSKVWVMGENQKLPIDKCRKWIKVTQ